MARRITRRRPIEDIRTGRATLTEVLFIAFALALSVNLLSSALASQIGTLASAVGAGILLVGSAGYLVIKFLWPRTSTASFDGVVGVVTKDAQSQLVEVKEYRFASDVVGALKSVMAENPALARQWQDDPIEASFVIDHDAGGVKLRESAALKLLNEAAEFALIEKLSTHLSGHFNSDEFERKRLRTLYRADVPGLVLTNRVLDLISRDPADRIGMENLTDKNVVASFGEQRYSRFDLTLPKDGNISRLTDGRLEIVTSGVTLRLSANAQGFNGGMASPAFDEHYAGHEPLSIRWYEVPIKVEARVSLALAFFSRSLSYYEWAESFVRDVENAFSFDAFTERIGWPQLEAYLKLKVKKGDND